MTFDDLFALLIVVIFIGLPLLNRLRGGGQPPPGRQGAPGRPAAPGRPVDPRTQAPGRPLAGPSAPAGAEPRDDAPSGRGDPMDELSRRLEEARRRVREAMGEQPDASGPRPLVSEPPRGQTIANAGIPSGTAGGAMRPPAPPPAVPSRPPTVRPGTSPVRRATPPAPEAVKRTGTGRRQAGLAKPTPGLEVERTAGRGAAGSQQERGRRARARREAAVLVSMDDQSIRKGLLWHMILGQPAAFGRGRLRSPRPSR